MANGHELGLSYWGKERELHLTYWDHLHGEDMDFIIAEDGQVYISEYADYDGLGADEPNLIPVNLTEELRKLADKLDERNERIKEQRRKNETRRT